MGYHKSSRNELYRCAPSADDVDDGSVAFRLDCLDYTHTCVYNPSNPGEKQPIHHQHHQQTVHSDKAHFCWIYGTPYLNQDNFVPHMLPLWLDTLVTSRMVKTLTIALPFQIANHFCFSKHIALTIYIYKIFCMCWLENSSSVQAIFNFFTDFRVIVLQYTNTCTS